MKAKQFISSFLAVIVAFGIIGCSSGSKGSFTAQKYTDFNNKQAKVNVQEVNSGFDRMEHLAAQHSIKSNKQSINRVSQEFLIRSTPKELTGNIAKVNTIQFSSKSNSIPVENSRKTVKEFKLKQTNRVVAEPIKEKAADDTELILLVILALLLPPLAVYLVRGLDTSFWINLILCFLFWVPGIIHALIVVLGDGGGSSGRGSSQRRSAAG